MAEAVALQVIVLHLAHALDAHRFPREVLAGAPAALAAGHARRVLAGARPVAPRMRPQRVLAQRFQLGREAAPHVGGEGGRDADVVQRAVGVEEPEQQRADERALALLVPAEAGDDAVGGAHVLHLDHGALAGLIGAAGRLGDDAVEAGALEAVEPVERHGAVAAARRQVDVGGGREQLLQQPAAFELRQGAAVGVVGEQIERDERGGDLGGELLDPRRRRMQAHLQRVEVEPVRAGDDDFAVDDAAGGEGGEQAGAELGEVAIERLQIAALDVEAVAVAKDDRAKAVPLRLEEPGLARRQLGGELGQHRLDRRLDRKRHRRPRARQRVAACRAAMRPAAELQPASNGWPGSSRSMTSGVWSEGIGFPLRASRSISDQTMRSATGCVTSRWSMRMPKFLWKLPAR